MAAIRFLSLRSKSAYKLQVAASLPSSVGRCHHNGKMREGKSTLQLVNARPKNLEGGEESTLLAELLSSATTGFVSTAVW